MAIETSGEWWIGSRPDDIRGFLEAYAAPGYEVNEFRLARCQCGSITFRLDADDNEGVARRTCFECGADHFICDSEAYWSDAQPDHLTCAQCGAEETNVGVGFSVYDDDPTGIRWLYVGVRCTRCGTLGCFAGWKVSTGGVAHLFDQV